MSVRSLHDCLVCSGSSAVLVDGVGDVYFGFPGKWKWRQCQASECGFAWPEEVLDDDDLARSYAAYYTHDTPAPGRADIAMGRVLLSLVKLFGRQFPTIPFLFREYENLLIDTGGIWPESGGIAIDVGCGSGERLPFYEALGWARAIGVDPDPKAVLRGADRNRDVMLGSAEDIPIDSGAASVVFMHHVIEHLRDVRTALQEVCRVLRPGGALVISTPNVNAEGQVKWGALWRGFESPRHLQLFTPNSLTRTLRDAGFEIEVCRSSARAIPFMNKAAALASSAPARASWFRFWLDDHAITRCQRRIACGDEIGEEVFAVARTSPSNVA